MDRSFTSRNGLLIKFDKQVLGAIDELGRRVKAAAEIVVLEQYYDVSNKTKLSPAEAFALVSSSVVDDNYIYEKSDSHGRVSSYVVQLRALDYPSISRLGKGHSGIQPSARCSPRHSSATPPVTYTTSRPTFTRPFLTLSSFLSAPQ